jgi:hypothetical protein
MPGVFDWPADKYLPILVPELTFGDKVTTPSYYGKRCTTGLGLRNSFFFRYEQPDLVTADGEIVKGLGSCKVSWSFCGNKITGDFIYTVPNQITLDKFRLVVAIGSPHSEYHVPMSYAIGENGLGVGIEKDDFQANWLDTEVVSEDPAYRSYWGNIHYLQVYARDRAMVMRPGVQYRITLSLDPDIAFAGFVEHGEWSKLMIKEIICAYYDEFYSIEKLEGKSEEELAEELSKRVISAQIPSMVVTMGGQVGKDISIWRDLSHGATEAMLDKDAADSVAYLRKVMG